MIVGPGHPLRGAHRERVTEYDSTGEPRGLNLLVYAAVVLLSGVRAAYYLFVHEPTRMRLRRLSSGDAAVT